MGTVEFKDEEVIEEEAEKIRKQKSRKRVFVLLIILDILLFIGVVAQVALTIMHAIESL